MAKFDTALELLGKLIAKTIVICLTAAIALFVIMVFPGLFLALWFTVGFIMFLGSFGVALECGGVDYEHIGKGFLMLLPALIFTNEQYTEYIIAFCGGWGKTVFDFYTLAYQWLISFTC